MDELYLSRIITLASIDIKDNFIKNKLLLELEGECKFALEKYLPYYDFFGELGKTQLDVWVADENLKRFYKGIGMVLAASKFKKALRKE